MSWLNSLNNSTLEYLNNLKKPQKEFSYFPTSSSLTKEGKEIELGFSCYAIKILKLLDSIDTLSSKEIDDWSTYINSFQVEEGNFPVNSFVDKKYLNSFQSKLTLSKIINPVKSLSNYLQNTNYKTSELKLENYVRAETKQSIATLHEISKQNLSSYNEFPKKEGEIYNFLNNLNWQYPWNSGAQFSAICVFSKTQLSIKDYKIARNTLTKFSDSIVNVENGLYYDGNYPNEKELINGAMKMITGFDWLDIEIHNPDKIIDFCLNYKIPHEGCDIVDLVYVLYRCSKETEYRKKDIMLFFENVLLILKKHLHNDGGFSYFENLNQTHYYDIKIADQKNQADIHGTLLCLWAVVMIMDFTENDIFSYKIIRP